MAMTGTELFVLTAQLRRMFARHGAILALCTEAERLSILVGRLEQVEAPTVAPVSDHHPKGSPKRDRAQYMRTYRARQTG